MFDTSKLRGRIVEKYGTCAVFAKAIGTTFQQVSKVLNGRTFLRQDDIYKWANALDIDAIDIPAYFLAIKTNES